MRALICAGGPDVCSSERLESLAASAQIVIACDSGANHLIAAGVQPDLLVGDLDSLEAEKVATLRASGVRIDAHPAEKDVTDFDLGLDAALVAGADSIVSTGIGGGTPDHFVASLGSLSRLEGARRAVVGASWDGEVLGAGEVSAVDAGVTFSLVALEPAQVDIEGAHWELVSGELEPLGSLGVGNRALPGGASIRVHSGTVLLIRRDTL